MNWCISILFGTLSFLTSFILGSFAAVANGINPDTDLVGLLREAGQGSIGTLLLVLAIKFLLNDRERDQKRRDEEDIKRDAKQAEMIAKNDTMWQNRLIDKNETLAQREQRINELEELLLSKVINAKPLKENTSPGPSHVTKRLHL